MNSVRSATLWSRYVPSVQEGDGYFDERIASRYDESAAEMFEPAAVEPVVDLLVELAGSGRALELGIGTGRIALPLAQRGVRVHASTSRRRWSRGCGRSRAPRTST
jgi:predicted O-methyltransferase YrrM